jgi:methyltransferase (TIGR00027 family)
VVLLNQNRICILFTVRNQQPSRTAEYMALFRAVETAEPTERRLFEDAYAIHLLSGTLKKLAELARLPLVGRLVPAFLDLGWPFTRSSGVVRTRMIDDLVCDAIRTGARQLVLLGAGFDSRSYRLKEAMGILTYEVDHPATQTAKRERLQSGMGKLPENVRFVAVDFEEDNLETELVKAGFDTKIPTVVVWEGVVSYLTESAVSNNLTLLARLLAPCSQLVFTYVHRGALDGSISFQGSRRWKSWVKRSGEPFIFGFDPVTLSETLRPYGFLLQSDESTAKAAGRYNPSTRRKETGSELYRVATAIRAEV